MVIPREPKIARNLKESCFRGLPESTLKKDTKNDRKSHFSGRLDMQSAHACAVQTHFFVFTFQWPKAPKKKAKSIPKWSLWAPKITKNQKKRTLKKTLKNECKKYQKWSQTRGRLSWRKGLKNHKNHLPVLSKPFSNINIPEETPCL